MSLPLLLDENIEHEAMHRLANYGHDVEYIDLHDNLRKGDPYDEVQNLRYTIPLAQNREAISNSTPRAVINRHQI